MGAWHSDTAANHTDLLFGCGRTCVFAVQEWSNLWELISEPPSHYSMVGGLPGYLCPILIIDWCTTELYLCIISPDWSQRIMFTPPRIVPSLVHPSDHQQCSGWTLGSSSLMMSMTHVSSTCNKRNTNQMLHPCLWCFAFIFMCNQRSEAAVQLS